MMMMKREVGTINGKVFILFGILLLQGNNKDEDEEVIMMMMMKLAEPMVRINKNSVSKECV